MINKIKETIKKHSMLKIGDRVLLCVSGGPDSVAMFYLFKEITAGMGLKLFLAHVNHTLRQKDSDRDQSYVEKLGKRQKIPVFVDRQDTGKFAKINKFSIEDSARRLRYKFFKEVVDKLSIDAVATAHTSDDQAETVLMRLVRGTGLKGLRGIPVKSNFFGALLIRPMIEVSRKEIETYLKAKRITPRIDTTNADTRFFRNRVRKNLIPLIEKEYSPRIKNLLLTLADLLGKDYEYLELKHKEDFRGILKKNSKGVVALNSVGFKKLHSSVKRGVLRTVMWDMCNGLEGIDYRHLKEIESLIDLKPPGSILYLPHHITVEKGKRCIRFIPADVKAPKKREIACAIVKVPGSTNFGRRALQAKYVKRVPVFLKKRKNIEYLDMAKIKFPLTIRTSKQGDRMKPLGMKGYKKISDIFIDEKIPLKKRSSIPLIVSADNEILSLCGIRISDRCRIGPSTRKTLKLELLTR